MTIKHPTYSVLCVRWSDSVTCSHTNTSGLFRRPTVKKVLFIAMSFFILASNLLRAIIWVFSYTGTMVSQLCFLLLKVMTCSESIFKHSWLSISLCSRQRRYPCSFSPSHLSSHRAVCGRNQRVKLSLRLRHRGDIHHKRSCKNERLCHHPWLE